MAVTNQLFNSSDTHETSSHYVTTIVCLPRLSKRYERL